MRRYVVFLCRWWYFWGGVFIVDFERDVIFSTRCSMALIAFSTPCHHLLLLPQPCFQIMMLTNFRVSISFYKTNTINTSLNTRMFSLLDAYSVKVTWTARASSFSSEYIVDSETYQANSWDLLAVGARGIASLCLLASMACRTWSSLSTMQRLMPNRRPRCLPKGVVQDTQSS